MHCNHRRTCIYFILVLSLVLLGCTSAKPQNLQEVPVTQTFVSTTPLSPSQTPSLVPSPTSPPPTPTPLPSPTPTPSAGGRSAGDPYTPELGNTGYDIQHYNLQLNLDPSKSFVEGVTTIQAESDVHNLVQISLDFIGFDIGELSVNNLPARFSREQDKLIIDMPNPLSIDEAFSVQITYEGSPTTESSRFIPFIDHLGFQFLGNSIFVISEPDGARYWFPSNDHPRDKATYRFEITVPEGFTAVANGLLVEEITNAEGENTFIWEHMHPMAPYLATVAVGEYERVESYSPDGVFLRHYFFPDLREEFDLATDITGEAIDWISDIFGPYPFEAYGFVTIRLIRASLETQSMVILSENMLNEETVIHELAHMWFGDWVSMESWADMWHNEGFAIYVSLMWQTRENPEALNVFMNNLITRIQENDNGEPLGNLPPQRLFGPASYQKGAALIHALRLEVGDEAFFSGLQEYFKRFGGGTASREEFQEIMEEKSGRELDDLFLEWLE